MRRAGACALIVAAFVLVEAGSASALVVRGWTWTYDSKSIPAQGWAWQIQRSQAPSLAPLSGVPEGDIAVAWLGQPDKIAYLGIGGTAAPLHGATLELAVDPEASNRAPETAELRACVIVSAWQPGESKPWDTKPITVCDDASEGAFDEEAEVFRFDLTPLADALSSGGVHGISIEPAEAPSASFEVVFKGFAAQGVRLTLPSETADSDDRDRRSADTSGVTEPAAAPLPLEPYVAPAPQPAAAQDEALLTVTERETPAPTLPRGRRFGLGGVYAALAALAALPLLGRVLASTTSRREEER